MTHIRRTRSSMTVCRKPYGKGMGGIQRTCRAQAGHSGRCTDMPYLRHLRSQPQFSKLAKKIERDALHTRGAAWPKNLRGLQKRKNRQPRWTLKSGDQLYPQHKADYETCLEVARTLTVHAYEMQGAPECQEDIRPYLGDSELRPGKYTCFICQLPIQIADFAKAVQSKALIETAHIDPTLSVLHTPANVQFAHRECNIAQGKRSTVDFLEWIRGILSRHNIVGASPG